MKLHIKTVIALTFLLSSELLCASVFSTDSIHRQVVDKNLRYQQALFHPTILFFQSGSDSLDAAALSMIEKLASDMKNRSNLSFIISGFTDPAGSALYNKKLSKKRAVKVENELIKRGFTESQIIIKPSVESQSKKIPLSEYSKMRKVEIMPVVLMK